MAYRKCKRFELDTLEKHKVFYEAMLLLPAKERLEYVISFYPDFKLDSHQHAGELLRLERETVTKTKVMYRDKRHLGMILFEKIRKTSK